MNEDGTFSPKFLKVLFAQLVKEAGGHDAAASVLKVSRQFVGQLCDTRNAEHAKTIPNWGHVWALEQGCGRSIVFAGLAEAVSPMLAPAGACVVKESNEVAQSAVRMTGLSLDVSNGVAGSEAAFDAAIEDVERQLDEARAARRARQSNITPLRSGQ